MSEQTQYVTPEELMELKKISNVRGLASVSWTWGWIVAVWTLYCMHPGVWTFLAGWIVMSGRHLALAILMHEGAHGLILNNRKWNDRVTQWLTAYPILSDTLVYRMYHLQHHRYTWTNNDPDLGLAKPFPVSRKSFWRKILRDLTGQTGYERYRTILRLSAGLSLKGRGLEGKPLGMVLKNLWNRQKGFFITNGTILAGLSVAGHPEAFLLLWWLPALTGYSLVLRIRNIAEHAVVPDPADILRQTRTTLAPFWVRFFMAPHNVNYHLEHHLYMYVPHYNLRKMHGMLRRNGTLDRAEVATSYLDVLRRATSASATEYDGKPRNRMQVFGGPVA